MRLSNEELIKQLRETKVPSRRLDEQLAFSVGWTVKEMGHAGRVWTAPGSEHPVGSCPRYTFNLDDAIGLLPEGWFWHGGSSQLWGNDEYFSYGWARFFPASGQQDGTGNMDAYTPTIALCLCRARYDGGFVGQKAWWP